MLPWPLMIMTGKSGCAFLMRSSSSSPSSREPCSQMSRIRSDGRRSSMYLSVSSLSLARRVPCPSSSRMPEISSLISASSSTTRMSDAMGHSLFFFLGGFSRISLRRVERCGVLGYPRLVLLSQRQVHTHSSAFYFSVPSRRIGERKRTAMLLGDALHDREAKPRTFLARGHVGLDQALAVLLG